LGNKGGTLLKQEMGASFRELRSGEKNRSVGRIYLEHALLVSDVMLALELGCLQARRVWLLTGANLPVMGEREPHAPFRWNGKIKEGLTLGAIPDRVFGLEFPDANGDPVRAFSSWKSTGVPCRSPAKPLSRPLSSASCLPTRQPGPRESTAPALVSIASACSPSPAHPSVANL
jgi:hypothetical protein